ADEAPRPGGDALGLDPGTDRWIAGTAGRLAGHPEVRLLTRTTVTGHYDHGELVALERRPDGSHLLWRIRARRTVLAAGSVERPFAFAGNDLPGVMLAGAAAAYVRRHGVLPGERIAVSGCHDEALLAAATLHDAGAEIAAVADARPEPGAGALAALARRGIGVRTATAAAGTVPDGRGGRGPRRRGGPGRRPARPGGGGGHGARPRRSGRLRPARGLRRPRPRGRPGGAGGRPAPLVGAARRVPPRRAPGDRGLRRGAGRGPLGARRRRAGGPGRPRRGRRGPGRGGGTGRDIGPRRTVRSGHRRRFGHRCRSGSRGRPGGRCRLGRGYRSGRRHRLGGRSRLRGAAARGPAGRR